MLDLHDVPAARHAGETRERRRQRTHPARKKPELLARRPNEVYSWDITKLQGPERGVYYQLFVIIDIYSRYVVGWMVAEAETGELAGSFIAEVLTRQGNTRDQLTLHADRGTSMTSKPVAQLLVDLGVARSHSRPHVSNDNPHSEANFETIKYCPAFPGRFGSIQDARAFYSAFFEHYNHVHRHSGIALHTPASVHYGTATEIRAKRAVTLDAAYAEPRPLRLPPTDPTPAAHRRLDLVAIRDCRVDGCEGVGVEVIAEDRAGRGNGALAGTLSDRAFAPTGSSVSGMPSSWRRWVLPRPRVPDAWR